MFSIKVNYTNYKKSIITFSSPFFESFSNCFDFFKNTFRILPKIFRAFSENFYIFSEFIFHIWFKGPLPLPKSSFAFIAPAINSFAKRTDSGTSCPIARYDAIALESVQPVPCVFGFSIRSPLIQIFSEFL